VIKALEDRGWYVVKLIQTNRNGIPDLLMHRDGVTRYVEVKRPGEKPRPLQEFRHKELRKAGIPIDVITDISQLSTF
jgi:Holliday junction resolvase